MQRLAISWEVFQVLIGIEMRINFPHGVAVFLQVKTVHFELLMGRPWMQRRVLSLVVLAGNLGQVSANSP